MDKAAGDPLVGTTVAHYRIEAKLGGGGMGVVYAARDTKLDRRVALKFLPPQWSHDESAKQRFIREAQAASATDHPNICTIHDIGTAGDGQLFIVMAHYDGQTLKQRLEAGPPSVEQALDIAAQAAEGLAKAHAQGIVHRDVKPGNVMLTEDGVRILDFGLAKFADARLKLTLEGSTLGTIAYMSPEQARGEEADARSDVWAAGVVLYEMLTGDMPFKGGYPEAIAHAIKNSPPAPIRATVPEVSEGLEQLVFRALHKDPGVRFQTARDMARALRILQGRTIPLDLRTEPLPPVDSTRPGRDSRRWWTSRKAASAAALAAVMVGVPAWVLSPVERVPVAVAPMVNQTGYAELDQYRMALTQELTAALSESRSIRVFPYDRLLQIVRRFRAPGQDVSSREATQALTLHSGARLIVVPTLLYEDNGWKARVEFRDAETATSAAPPFETELVVSSLMKDAVYGLLAPLAVGIQDRFLRAGPRRAYVAGLIRTPAGAPTPRLRSVDASAAFEQGLDAYDQLEYAAALRSFITASEQDARSPLPFAWQSRVASLMRQSTQAVEAADQGTKRVGPETPPRDALFIAAVAAESRPDPATAESRYRELASRFADEPFWLTELAGFLDRRMRTEEAIVTYQQALTLDGHLIRPDLELCRLYNRSNESAKAREHAERAMSKYRAIGATAGEAQVLLCMTETLRVGGATERQQARSSAEMALKMLGELGQSYNLARAYHYVAMTEWADQHIAAAAATWERALVSARAVGNVDLESALLTNLGVAHESLGDRPRALEYYRQGYRVHEAIGDEGAAAYNRAFVGGLLIHNGGDPETGLRDVQNALAVARQGASRDLEVLCLRTMAAYYRYGGRYQDAERELTRALAIARELDLEQGLAQLTIDLASSRFDQSDYTGARQLLATALGDASGPERTRARILLGWTLVRLGDVDAAQAGVNQAAGDLRTQGDTALSPLLQTVQGELAYERGDLREARARFAGAASLWRDALPDAASVEARASLGLLDALEGRIDAGRMHLQASLEQARKMRRVALEARCRVYLARLALAQRRPAEALDTLRDIPTDPELQAQVHYWRGRALAAQGDRPGARAEQIRARQLVEMMRASLPDAYRVSFVTRTHIRQIVG